MQFLYRTAIMVWLACLSFFSVAQDDQALNTLSDKLARISTISATFAQYSLDQKGNRLQESKGELKASREGRLYWRTYEPLEQIVVSDAATVTVYDPDLEQATIQKVTDQAATTPAILFSGEVSKIGEYFEVSQNNLPDNIEEFTLKPVGQDGLFDTMSVRFRNNSIVELGITDALGQKSTMSFIQTQVNLDFTSKDFELDLPEGTDVIRDIPVTKY